MVHSNPRKKNRKKYKKGYNEMILNKKWIMQVTVI